jgi:dTMP kinase
MDRLKLGDFATIEGGDGSGKATQTKIFAEYTRDILNLDVLQLSFPSYGERQAVYVERYLNGQYGEGNAVSADLASLPYALDRFAKKDLIQRHLELPNSLVLSDRYSGSNFAHQGTKFTSGADRKAYYEEMMWLEWEFLGIPKPDINIVLLVKSALSQANVDKKAARGYTALTRDIHEADSAHLELAKQNYEELTRIYPDTFVGVDCMEDEARMFSIEATQLLIRKVFQEYTENK